ncbi:MAG: archease [Candidatus Diapherotrites archaeon]|nr:archease [Candidatus Diapherotrites archaeon]
MPFSLFEHKADVGIRGSGKNLNEAFAQAGTALFEVMADTRSIKPAKKVRVRVNGADEAELLVNFLNELVFLRDKHQMLFGKFKIRIQKKRGLQLTGEAAGEKINFKRHLIKTEVKAATYSQLKVEQKKKEWLAQCIVDV